MKKIVALMAICSPLFMQAQGFQVSLQGQKQQAMGGAGTALVQDGAALFYNPGGVSFLRQNSASAGMSGVVSRVQYRDEASATVSETESPVGTPFTAYMVLGKKESPLRYGLAVYTPFGSTIDWQDDWTGRFVINRLQLASIYVQPTVSYKLTEQLGIGAGFVYGIGKFNLQRDLPVADEDGNYGKAELAGNGRGIGFNAGAYYKPGSKFSLGLTYRSRVNMDLNKGTATFTVPASLAAGFPNGNFSASLPLPSIATLGLAYTPVKKLTLALDASRIGWKVYDTLAFDFENNTPTLPDSKSARVYRNTSAYRFGAQYGVTTKLDVRAGMNYFITPVQDGYVTPEVPDATHANYTLGLGYRFNSRLSADVSFIIENMERKAANAETGMNGTYKTALRIPGLSLSYNF